MSSPTVQAEIIIFDNVTHEKSIITTSDVLSFSFIKERYTPYTTLKLSCLLNKKLSNAVAIKFYIDSKLIHYGAIDTLENNMTDRSGIANISTRGFSLALGLNEPTPNINSNVNLTNLLSRNVSLPNVSVQSGTTTIGYIYVLENSTLWDAVVAYSLKAYSTYPYISGTNTIRVTVPSSVKTHSYTKRECISDIHGTDFTNIISHVHMADENGNYGIYNKTNDYAVQREYIRHKQTKLDKQWLADTSGALNKSINFSMRGNRYFGIKYKGYKGEDLMDNLKFPDENLLISVMPISKIKIIGNKNGVFTTVLSYVDNY